MQCSNNLKQIGLALYNYHDLYGSFPPAYVADEDGKPMHSWRVLLLPFLEQEPLYDQYDFDEPWNGPNNSKLAAEMPWVYACPQGFQGAKSTFTSYLAVVGDRTAWPGKSAKSLGEITDAADNTILVVERDNQSVPWLAPQDLEFGAALELFASSHPEAAGNHRSEDFFFYYYSGRNVLFVDGSVRFVYHGVPRNVWSALLGAPDGIAVGEDDFEMPLASVRQLKVGNCIRLGIFIVLTLFPLPWVWLNPTPDRIPVEQEQTSAGLQSA